MALAWILKFTALEFSVNPSAGITGVVGDGMGGGSSVGIGAAGMRRAGARNAGSELFLLGPS